jgi:hypothetical protein
MSNFGTRIRRTFQSMALLSITMAAMTISGCVLSFPSESINSISWEHLVEGQTVYGIVKLTLRISSNNVREVRFFQDVTDEEHLIGIAELNDSSVYTCDWFTQDTINGTYMVHAIATPREGSSTESKIMVTVMNRSRAQSIPANAVKMTPANDKAPPQLVPTLKGIWRDPIPLEGSINTAGAEDSPFITPNGDTFYFWFNGDEMRDVQEQVKDPMTGIYWSKKVDGKWQEPQRLFLQYFDKLGFDGDATVRGNILWFGSIREGNYRDIDIWTAELVNGKWIRWTNAGELLNKIYSVGELHVTADGREIYFGSTRSGGKGQSDIWVIRSKDGQWQQPENINAVNTDGNEGQPFVSEDGNELWFTRSTPGPSIYRSLKVAGKWQPPELVVSTVVGEPTLDKAGNLYFTHLRWDDTLNRVTEADIYVCYRK